MERWKGTVYTVLSAVIYGTSPILVKLATEEGMSATTNVFFRSIVAMLVCFVAAGMQKQSVLVRGKALRDALIAVICGQGLTSVLLNFSYNYLPAGMATSLHFVYPSVVMLSCVLLFRERVNGFKIAALTLSISAVMMMADIGGSIRLFGILIALLSGCTFAFFIVYMDHSSIKDFPMWTYAFWSALGCTVASGVFGMATGTLTFAGIRPAGYLLALVMVPFHSIIAMRLFQLGVRYTGSTAASLLSTMEPVTSIVCGILLLRETMNGWKLAGCMAIILSVVLVVLGNKHPEAASLRAARSVPVRK